MTRQAFFKIVKNGDGSKLLLNLVLIGQIVEEVVKSTNKPVTVKIRKGWNDENIVAVEAAKIIEAAGFEVQEYDGGLIRVTCRMEDGSAPYVILSPRTRDQGLKTAAEQLSGKGAGDEQA